jgi:hypothetical protein
VKRKSLTLSIVKLVIPVLGLSVTVISPARAQVTPESSELPTIEVTGSLIRTTDLVNFNQAQVVTDKDIEASGAVTVADFPRSTAENSASSWADDFAYGSAVGTQSQRYSIQRARPTFRQDRGLAEAIDGGLNTVHRSRSIRLV